MEGGPLVLPTLLDVPQGPSLGRCFFLRGSRASCRTKEHSAGVCGTTGRADLHHIPPAPTRRPTPLFAAPCCSQPVSHQRRRVPVARWGHLKHWGVLQVAEGLHHCCSVPLLHSYVAHRYLGARGLERLLSSPRRVAVPTDPAP